jgi:hypothetical protein
MAEGAGRPRRTGRLCVTHNWSDRERAQRMISSIRDVLLCSNPIPETEESP